jgi:magnesium transporter
MGDVLLRQVAGVMAEDGQFVWIGLYEPIEELLRDVQREFGLHDLAIEGAHLAHQRPKVELYDDSLFVVLRAGLGAGISAGDRQHEIALRLALPFKRSGWL